METVQKSVIYVGVCMSVYYLFSTKNVLRNYPNMVTVQTTLSLTTPSTESQHVIVTYYYDIQSPTLTQTVYLHTTWNTHNI